MNVVSTTNKANRLSPPSIFPPNLILPQLDAMAVVL